MRNTRHFALRLTRFGPLVPARLAWCDHEPGEPDNKLDRGPRSLYPVADIAGVEVAPEELTERLVSLTDTRSIWPPKHWKHAAPITAEEYGWRLRQLRTVEARRPDDPVLRPRRQLGADDVAIPDFEREERLL